MSVSIYGGDIFIANQGRPWANSHSFQSEAESYRVSTGL